MTNLMFQIVLGGILISATTALQVCFIGFMMVASPNVKSWLNRISMFKITTIIAGAESG